MKNVLERRLKRYVTITLSLVLKQISDVLFQFDSEKRDNGQISNRSRECLAQELNDFRITVIKLNEENKSKLLQEMGRAAALSATIGAVGIGASAIFSLGSRIMAPAAEVAAPGAIVAVKEVVKNAVVNVGAAIGKAFN